MLKKLSTQLNTLTSRYNQNDLSIADLLCDRHEQERIALYYENAKGTKRTYTYGELSDLSKRFANVLRSNGVKKGDRVAILLPKGPEILISALAVWRLGAIYVPLFTAFAAQAISYRVEHSGASVIITDSDNRGKLNDMTEVSSTIDLSQLSIITVAHSNQNRMDPSDTEFWGTLNDTTPVLDNTTVTKDDLMILIYTSGTTGHPKGVEVPAYALAAFEGYMQFGLDLTKGDIFWNIADPGWAYGLYYGIVGPLLLGQTFVMYDAKFDVRDTYRILKDYQVTNFAAAPTIYRAIRVEGAPDDLKGFALRRLSSAGEPLNPGVSEWAQHNLGLPIYDHYGQTELGMAINNHHNSEIDYPIKLGSMGGAMPGYQATIVDEEGNEQPSSVEGELALDIKNSPVFWFRGYYKDRERTDERFISGGRYYLTGDSATRDEDDLFYFSGRSDDIIISSGYKIGPFEVESSLMRHEAVAETAVVGVPDEMRGETVKAFVVLRSAFTPSEELKQELGTFVKRMLSAHEYPREITFIDELPKTPSGKLQRFLLR